eukprot:scaffold859_cov306-Pinguiococcus_pyrenoidosus.AAC.11
MTSRDFVADVDMYRMARTSPTTSISASEGGAVKSTKSPAFHREKDGPPADGVGREASTVPSKALVGGQEHLRAERARWPGVHLKPVSRVDELYTDRVASACRRHLLCPLDLVVPILVPLLAQHFLQAAERARIHDLLRLRHEEIPMCKVPNCQTGVKLARLASPMEVGDAPAKKEVVPPRHDVHRGNGSAVEATQHVRGAPKLPVRLWIGERLLEEGDLLARQEDIQLGHGQRLPRLVR